MPMQPYTRDVDSLYEGKRILDFFADYDNYQIQNFIKPDCSNMGGLEVFEGGEWIEWEDEDGNTIDDLNNVERGQV